MTSTTNNPPSQTAARSSGVRYQDLDHGISCIDVELQNPGVASCYLLVSGDEAAFIDCGTGNSVPLLLEVLRLKGLTAGQVRYVIPTHVHLDHAGGAGGLMAQCPNAELVVHPRGARHMIDPGKLEQGALAVYGESRFRRLFGQLTPVVEERVISAEDGMRLDFNGRELLFLDTPGHARHHVCIFDEAAQGMFTGDTFGASYPQLNAGRARFIFPPTTPVQFDPQAWQLSLDRLLSLMPARVYLTHYGAHEQPEALATRLRQSIAEYAEVAVKFVDASNREARIESALMQAALDHLKDQQCGLDNEQIRAILAMDMRLNAQGLDHWLTVAERQ